MTRSARTRTAVLLSLVAAVLAAGGAAYAVARAQAQGSQPLAVGSFGAQASLSATTASQSGPLVLAYTVNSDTAPRTFFVRNTGTSALVGQTWSVSVVNTAAGTKGNATVHACSGSYSSTGVCSGTETLVATATELQPTVTVNTDFRVPVGGAYAAKFTPVGVRGFNATIGLSVSRSQIAPASTRSS